MHFGPDPAWVRTGKRSIHDARGMVTELAKWFRKMESLQHEEDTFRDLDEGATDHWEFERDVWPVGK